MAGYITRGQEKSVVLSASQVDTLVRLHTVAHQQIDHIHRQTQIVIQSRQNLQVGGFQLFAQLLLRLGHQHTEAAVGLQQVGQLVGGIDPVLVRRGGRLLSTLQKAHVLQSGFRRFDRSWTRWQPKSSATV